MGLAVAYWTYGPERPEPVWGGDPEAVSVDRAAVWADATQALLGRALGVGPGTRQRLVRELGIGAPQPELEEGGP